MNKKQKFLVGYFLAGVALTLGTLIASVQNESGNPPALASIERTDTNYKSYWTHSQSIPAYSSPSTEYLALQNDGSVYRIPFDYKIEAARSNENPGWLALKTPKNIWVREKDVHESRSTELEAKSEAELKNKKIKHKIACERATENINRIVNGSPGITAISCTGTRVDIVVSDVWLGLSKDSKVGLSQAFYKAAASHFLINEVTSDAGEVRLEFRHILSNRVIGYWTKGYGYQDRS